MLVHTKEMLCGDFQIIQSFKDANLLKILKAQYSTQLFRNLNLIYHVSLSEMKTSRAIYLNSFWKKFVQLQNKLVIFAFPSSPWQKWAIFKLFSNRSYNVFHIFAKYFV